MAVDRVDTFSESDVNGWQAALGTRHPREILAWGIESFGRRLAIATSFQVDGMAILDMAWKIDPHVRVITVDSGRLHEESYSIMERVRERYGIPIEVYYPNTADIEAFVRREGVNAFYRDVSLRKRCCELRKVSPVKKALAGLDAWVTGQRRDQAWTRRDVQAVEVDMDHGSMLKLNPLATWTAKDVWAYVRSNNVPYNTLYDKGFTSIGCAPCSRPTQDGEDPRAGRWWWEQGEAKECGIHRTRP